MCNHVDTVQPENYIFVYVTIYVINGSIVTSNLHTLNNSEVCCQNSSNIALFPEQPLPMFDTVLYSTQYYTAVYSLCVQVMAQLGLKCTIGNQ